MIQKIFSVFVIYLFLASSLSIGIKAQEKEINWDDGKEVEQALKKDPISTIQQNPERAKEYIRTHPKLVLENENIGNAYFNSLGIIADSRDKDLAQKFLSKVSQKNFDVSKGKLQIKDGKIVDENGKNFAIEEIKLMVDVIKVESLDGGGLRFYFKKKSIVDILEAGNLKQDNKGNLLVDNKQILLPDSSQTLIVTSDNKKLVVSCLENCNFERNGLKVNLKQGRYEETGNLIRTEKSLVSSGNDRLYGNAEFYNNGLGIDKTKPISLIGESSSAFVDGQNHRVTPRNLPTGPQLKDKLLDSISKNKEFIDGIIDANAKSVIKICIQCDVKLKENFDKDLDSGKLNGYVFELTNPISNKKIILNKGEVISNYENAIVIGAHKSSEFRTNINENNMIVDGPHSKENNAYLGSVIANSGKIDYFNENGKTMAKQDRMYQFGNVPSTRFFFPDVIDESVRKLITLREFIKAAQLNPSSSSGTIAINRLLGGARNIDLIQEPTLKKAYENLAGLLEDDKKSKQVANLNDAFIKDQKVTNLYLFKNNGELKLSQSGENHELYKVIAKEQINDAYLSYLAKNPKLANDPQSLSQFQRLMEYMVWKNTAVHEAAARYEKLTNVWGYIPLTEFNPYLRVKGVFSSEEENLFKQIVENDQAQDGAQTVIREMERGSSLKQVRETYPDGTNSKVDFVFRDPGIKARVEIEGMSQNIKDPIKFESEKVRILRDTANEYNKQNAPDQALIFQAEVVKEDILQKYGKQGEEIYKKLFDKRGELCNARQGCGGLFEIVDTNKIRTGQLGDIKNKLQLGAPITNYYFTYPSDWSPQLADDIKKLYDTNSVIQGDEATKKFKNFVENFFDADQLAIGLGISVATGGASAIIGKFGNLIKSTSSTLGRAALRGGEALALGEDAFGIGISSSLVGKIPSKTAKYTIDDVGKLFEKEGIKLDSSAEIWFSTAFDQKSVTPEKLADYFEATKGIDPNTRQGLIMSLTRESFTPEELSKLREIEGFDRLNIDAKYNILEGVHQGNIKIDDVPGLIVYLYELDQNFIRYSDLTEILATGVKVQEIKDFVKSVDNFDLDKRIKLISGIKEGDYEFKDLQEVLKVEGSKNLKADTVYYLATGLHEGNLDANQIPKFIKDVKKLNTHTTYSDIEVPLVIGLTKGTIQLDEIPPILKTIEDLEHVTAWRLVNDLSNAKYSLDEFRRVVEIRGVEELGPTAQVLAEGVHRGTISIEDIPQFVEIVKYVEKDTRHGDLTYGIAYGIRDGRIEIKDIPEFLSSIQGLELRTKIDIMGNINEGKYTLDDLKEIFKSFPNTKDSIVRLLEKGGDDVYSFKQVLKNYKNPEKIEEEYIRFIEENKLSLKDEFVITGYEESSIKPTLNELVEKELDAVVKEAAFTKDYILGVKKQADSLGREVVVICNPSYGYFACSPIVEELQQRGVNVWFNRIGSTEAHDNERILAASGRDDLFSDAQRKFIYEKDPVVIVVDGTTSFGGDITRSASHLPDSHKAFRNQLALDEYVKLTQEGSSHAKAIEDVASRFNFPGGTTSLEDLIESPKAQEIISKLKDYKPDTSKYTVWQWNPDGVLSEPRMQKQVVNTPFPISEPQDIRGPELIFLQPTSLEKMKKEFPYHRAAFFDDRIQVSPTLTPEGFKLMVFCEKDCGPGKVNIGNLIKERARELGVIK